MSIIISTERIKVCQYLYDLCEYCGYDKDWADKLWAELVCNEDIYAEFVYYLENHSLADSVTVEGYSFTDLYFFQMNKYNLLSEIGKNPVECNKERMVLNAFMMMINLRKDPATYIKRLEEGKGEDRL